MSFHSANIKHPEIPAEYSGTATATADAAPVTYDSEYAASGVWLKNEDEAESVRVMAEGQDDGFLLSPNTSRFFPVDNANKLWIKRAGETNVTVSYHVS